MATPLSCWLACLRLPPCCCGPPPAPADRPGRPILPPFSSALPPRPSQQCTVAHPGWQHWLRTPVCWLLLLLPCPASAVRHQMQEDLSRLAAPHWCCGPACGLLLSRQMVLPSLPQGHSLFICLWGRGLYGACCTAPLIPFLPTVAVTAAAASLTLPAVLVCCCSMLPTWAAAGWMQRWR